MQGLLLLLLIGTGLIFFLQNRQPIELHFFGTTAEAALATFTLPLGLWVVTFLTLGVFTSLVINILSAIGQPKPRPQSQNFRPNPNPPRRSPTEPFEPTPPRSPNPPRARPEPEPIVEDDEWDWDDPIQDLTDWDGKKPEPPPKREVREIKDSPRNAAPKPTIAPEKINPQTPEPLSQDQANSDFNDQNDLPDVVEQPAPINREPLPDLRQFEAPQTPKSTKQEGTIYSQQYRPARPSQPKPKQEQPKVKPSPSNSVYDVPYRVINSAPSPQTENEDDFGEEEEWI